MKLKIIFLALALSSSGAFALPSTTQVSQGLGGAGSITGALKGNGAGVVSQAGASDLSNGVSGSGAVCLVTSCALVTPNLGTPSAINLSNATAMPLSGITGLGTGVATQLGNAVSTAGGSTQTIAAGATALGTGAITSAACATVVTATATNTATTDTVTASFNGDPTAVTGYVPLTAGLLTIFVYPTLNTVNFKVCNATASSITPGAITLNWRVVR